MKRTIIITLLFSLISSVSTYLLFHSMEGFKTEIKESKIAVKEMQSQVNSIENKYKSEIQYWVQKNNDLQKQIQQTETNLNVSKQKENSLQGKIQVLISESKTLKDTSEIISNSDSIKENVNQFISETNTKDSLCDKEISELKNVIQNKDSAFAVCERGFLAFHGVVDFSLAQQTALADKLNEADKKIRRSNFKSKLLTAGVMILSGVTTILLLKK
jgi:chromosome segregation ATPase